MSKRRLLSIFMILMLMLSLTASAPAIAEKQRTEIEFWFGLGGGLGETMDSIIDAFNNSQDEVFVKGVKQGDYSETGRLLQAAAAAGTLPATVLMNHQNLKSFFEKGILAKLDDRIAANPDFKKDDLIPSFMEYCTSKDGEIMGLPVYGTTQIMYYRKDAFEKAGIDPEWAFKNWQNLAEAAAKMAVKENGQTVFYGWEPMSGSDNLIDAACSNGAQILSEDEKTVLISSPEFVEAWEAIRGWIHDDQIMGIHFGGEGWEYWYKTIDDVMQGRAAGYTGSSGDQGDLDFSIVAAHIQPGFNDHGPKPYADTVTCGLVANIDEKQAEAGFKWLTYLTGAEASGQFSMKTGYIPVRSSVVEDPAYKAYLQEHPQALVPIKQAEIARKQFIDPTGGKISTALGDACDLVEIENVPAAQALADAQAIAQAALDEYWAEKGE